MKKLWKTLIVLLCCIMASALIGVIACTTEEPAPTVGTVKGLTLDENGDPLEGVEIYYAEEDYVESDENGNFEIKDLTVGDITLTANLNGYAEAQKNLTAKDFNNGTANVNIVMEEGKGTITGTVRMDGHPEVKLKGAKVSINSEFTAITGENGEYELTGVPMLNRKTVKVTLSGYEDASKNVVATNYKDGVYKLNFDLVEEDLEELPGLKPYSLEKEPIDSDITVIRSGDIGYYFDASPDGLQGQSKIETHSEGYCINANTKDERDTMVAFIAANIEVDAKHKYVTVFAREFNGQNNESDGGPFYAQLGMYAFDDEKTFINDSSIFNTDKDNKTTVNGFTKITTESYMPVTFDLSAYAGKTITIIIGTKGGYHCCVDRIEFSSNAPVNTGIGGLEQINPQNPNENDTFDKEALKADWAIGGAAEKIDGGVWLNCKDPWKAEAYNKNNPQPINSYMYVTKNITADNKILSYTATIDKIVDCYDTKEGNEGFYFPYLQVYVVDANGATVYSSGWSSYWAELDADSANAKHEYDKGGLKIYTAVTEDNKTHTFEFDLSDAIGKGDVTIIIACNVGYKATITDVAFKKETTPEVTTPEVTSPDETKDPDEGEETQTSSN